MIEFSRHIEILLLTNDCVVVPDFGGFMAYKVDARYDEEDRSLLPPMRTLGFNPQLRMNDSLLAQSYVEAYDISYPEAVRRIEQEVEELKQVLNEEGSYTLNDLGEMTVNQEGNMVFSPNEAGILSPELYGLSVFSFKRLKDEEIQKESFTKAFTVPLPENKEERKEETPLLLDFTDDKDTKDDDAINIKMSWIRNTVAVVAAIAVFFLLSTPIVNSELGTQAMSHMQNSILNKLMPKDSNMVPAEPVKAEVTKKADATAAKAVAVAEKAADVAKQTADVAEKKPDVAEKKVEKTKEAAPKTSYYIVLASQVKRQNAESFVEQLHQKGLKQADILEHNNVIRVVCGCYDTESEAYRQAGKLHKMEGLEEAWVFKSKVQG